MVQSNGKTEHLQKEMWKFIEAIQKESKIDYVDCVTIFMLTKITDLQIQIDKLTEEKIGRYESIK